MTNPTKSGKGVTMSTNRDQIRKVYEKAQESQNMAQTNRPQSASQSTPQIRQGTNGTQSQPLTKSLFQRYGQRMVNAVEEAKAEEVIGDAGGQLPAGID